jgi:hypothetical protein
VVAVFCEADEAGVPPVMVHAHAVGVLVERSLRGTLTPVQTGLVTLNDAVGTTAQFVPLSATMMGFPHTAPEVFLVITAAPPAISSTLSVLLFCPLDSE